VGRHATAFAIHVAAASGRPARSRPWFGVRSQRRGPQAACLAAGRSDVPVAQGAAVNATDSHGRTPLHVAAYAGRAGAMRALVKVGADPNALEHDRYDIVTIAAVADDLPTLEVALEVGCSAREAPGRAQAALSVTCGKSTSVSATLLT